MICYTDMNKLCTETLEIVAVTVLAQTYPIKCNGHGSTHHTGANSVYNYAKFCMLGVATSMHISSAACLLKDPLRECVC